MHDAARSTAVLFVSAALLVSVAPRAEADWPMPRHDAGRTGAASGTSNLTSPVPYWRRNLGGQIDPLGALVVDLDASGLGVLILETAGTLVAKHADDSPVWSPASTPPHGILAIVGASDLDGDGTPDVVARSTDHVLVFSAATGALEWSEPDGEMGTIGGVRMADLDGDGKLDIFVQECGCCSVSSGKTGFIYSFAGGFGAPQLLWTLPWVECGGSDAMTIVDPDGSGKNDVVLATTTDLLLLDGKTGAVLGDSGSLAAQVGSYIQTSACTPVSVDGKPGQELVCLDNNAHQLFVLGYDAASQTLPILWQQAVGSPSGSATIAPGLVADLQGDGAREVTLGSLDAAGNVSTLVFDAATGTPLGSLPGEQLAGTLSGALSGGAAIVVTVRNQNLDVWTFERGATPPFSQLATLPGRQALYDVDHALSLVSSLDQALLATPLAGQSLTDLLVTEPAAASSPPEVFGVGFAGGMAKAVASYTLPAGTDLQTAWIVPSFTLQGPQLLVARSDGFITAHDGSLAAVNAPGVHFGGYYAAGAWRQLDTLPAVGALGAPGGQSILVPDSRGTLLRLDAATSSFASPPAAVWSNAGTSSPSILPGLDGKSPGIVCVRDTSPPTDPPTQQIVALHADGTDLWSRTLGGLVVSDPVAGDLDGDGVPDVVVQWTQGAQGSMGNAFSIAKNTALWDVGPFGNASGHQPAGGALFDWNGDGLDDFLFQALDASGTNPGTHVVSGLDGTVLASGGPVVDYFMPIPVALSGGGPADLLLTAGGLPIELLGHDLGGVLWSGTDPLPLPYGAVATCPGVGPLLVEGSWSSRSQLTLTDLGTGAAQPLVLAGGKGYPDEASAMAAGATLGQLTAVSVHQDLSGEGRPSAVVGSDDGWLYSVNPCTAALDFSVSFGLPVGAPVFGDTDGDGLDEILVSVQDGYLYDLKQPPLAAPAWVLDIDPSGDPNTDVTSEVTVDELAAKWATVAGATSYEVAVVPAAETSFVTAPPWQGVGVTDHVTLHGLPLEDGQRYLFAVRALKGTGRSPDTLSKGVTVHFPRVPDAGDAGDAGEEDGGMEAGAGSGGGATGAGGGGGAPPSFPLTGRACTCEAPGAVVGAMPAAWGLFGVGMAVAARRRRRRRS